MRPSSAKVSAPSTATRPPIPQASSAPGALAVTFATARGTKKIPTPMMAPTTTQVASHNPSTRRSSVIARAGPGGSPGSGGHVGPAQGAARALAGDAAIRHHRAAVHKHLADPHRVLGGALERGEVADRQGIEHGDVGEHTGPQQAAVGEADARRRQ